MSDPIILATKGLVVGYAASSNHQRVLENVNLELRKGELVCLLGANGSGKSTLLRTLAGLQPAMDGQISLKGQELNSLTPHERSRLVSVVLTMTAVSGMLTAREMIAHGRHPFTNWAGILSSEDNEKIDQALRNVRAESFANRDVSELSDGERQRILIARALAQETPLILLDEPTSFLDIIARAELMRLLRQLTRELNIAILLTSHDLSLVLNTVDHCLVIESETSLLFGRPKEMLSDGTFSRIFTGEGVSLDKKTGALIIEDH